MNNLTQSQKIKSSHRLLISWDPEPPSVTFLYCFYVWPIDGDMSSIDRREKWGSRKTSKKKWIKMFFQRKLWLSRRHDRFLYWKVDVRGHTNELPRIQVSLLERRRKTSADLIFPHTSLFLFRQQTLDRPKTEAEWTRSETPSVQDDWQLRNWNLSEKQIRNLWQIMRIYNKIANFVEFLKNQRASEI